ncbi:MAG: HAMP domain-containing protein [Lachnospiraceae bacterium]|nr:HAMP domain-containing protein [Lachnospiraceae bacterium]
MRHSIRLKLTLLLVILMIAVFGVTVIFSNLYIETYFEKRVERSLANTFDELNNKLPDVEHSDPEASKNTISEIVTSAGANANDARIFVYDNTGENIYSNMVMNEKDARTFMYLAGLFWGQQNSDEYSETMISGESYIIQKDYVNSVGAYYYDLIGKVGDRYYIVIRKSVAAVKESESAAVELFTIIGIAMTLIGSICMMIVASRFSNPIHRMAEVAERMKELDFDARVGVKGKDEVAVLGNTINDLSDKLKHTIEELKSANVELSKDIEKKEEIDEMRKEFLSHVSHELKTPIALIQGYAEGLRDNISDDIESREFYCDVIVDEAGKMNTMVKKLLSLNELEFGNNKLDVERFDITDLVNNIIQSSSILLSDFDGKLSVEETGPIYCWADAYRISEVITNYLTNAIHYVNPGGEIRVNYTMEDKEVKVSVYNSGSHLSEEELKKIWVKFYKVDKARTREYGGSGIGLSIVAATMEAHDKRYGARNIDDGIEFYFYLDTDIGC